MPRSVSVLLLCVMAACRRKTHSHNPLCVATKAAHEVMPYPAQRAFTWLFEASTYLLPHNIKGCLQQLDNMQHKIAETSSSRDIRQLPL